ncbi:MAG: DUF4829 domain-containing protein, partial [Candidatus Cryosericum sp.]
RYCVLISLCIVAGLLLAGCSTGDTKPSEDQAHAEQVVRDHFRYWNEKNLAGLQKTTNLYQPNVDWELDKLESVNLVSVTPGKVHTNTRQSFRATFDVKAKPGMFMTIDDGRHIWKIVLTRENTDAPWIMTDWGPVLDE